MSDAIKKLQRTLEEFEQSPEARGVEFRLMLADLIIGNLRKKGWSQKQLAEKLGMKESFVSRLVHAEANFTSEVAGRIFFALGIEPYIGERPSEGDYDPDMMGTAIPIQVFDIPDERYIYDQKYEETQNTFKIKSASTASISVHTEYADTSRFVC